MNTLVNRSSRHAPKIAAWCACVATLALGGAVTVSHAQQTWQPERNVEVVIPSSSGSSLDAGARMVQKVMQEARIVAVPVLVQNKSGGSGNIATAYLEQRAGDPHYVLKSAMSLMNNHILGRSKTNYTDFTQIALMYSEHMTIVVPANSPVKTAGDIRDRLRADPQSMSVAIGFAPGGTNHLNMALVMNAMGIDTKKLKTVAFPGNAQTLTALMGGHVDMASMSFAQAYNGMQQGKLRIIGVAAETRGEGMMAELPTWKEQGFHVVFENTRFILGTKGMTPAQIAFWDNALQRTVQHDEWKKFAARMNFTPNYVGSKEAPQRLAAMYKQIKDALVAVGMVAE